MFRKAAVSMGMALFFSSPLFAAHPLVTDDTGTQGRGGFQIEINGEMSFDKSTEGAVTTKTKGSEAAAVLSYGITETADIIIGVPYQWSKSTIDGATQSDADGIADISTEIKLRFYEHKGFSLALKPSVTLPAGDENKGLGNGKASYSVTFIPMVEIEPWMVHLNLAYTHRGYKLQEDEETKRNNIWHISLAGGLDILTGLKIVGNIGIETNEDKSSHKHPAFVLTGLIYSLSERLDLDAGVKKSLNEPETDIKYLTGLAVRF